MFDISQQKGLIAENIEPIAQLQHFFKKVRVTQSLVVPFEMKHNIFQAIFSAGNEAFAFITRTSAVQ